MEEDRVRYTSLESARRRQRVERERLRKETEAEDRAWREESKQPGYRPDLDNYDLGSAPWDEDCAQVGFPGYWEKAVVETRLFIAQLNEQFKKVLRPNMKFRSTRNPHDFGTYLSVVIEYDRKDRRSREIAAAIEDEMRPTWTEANAKALGLNR